MKTSLSEYVGWVASLEAKAARIYRKLALATNSDKDLALFARKLSEEEEWHYRAIRSVDKEIINIVAKKKNTRLVDDKIINNIEGELEALEKAVDTPHISTEEMLDRILSLELSELNTVFLDLVDLFSDHRIELQALKSHVRRHQKGIEAFARRKGITRGEAKERIGRTDYSHNNILVVEDEPAIREVLLLALKRYGRVETAADGMEALQKVKKKHYDLIFSDIDMPEMTGIEFFTLFHREDPYLNRRIIFFSGAIGGNERAFVKRNNIKCLEKPSSLVDIRKAALSVLEREPEK